MEEKSEEQIEDERCPKIEPVNNNMNDLTYNERLDIINEEAQSLYAFCMRKKFSEKELYECVSNLHGPRKSTAKKALDDSLKPFLCLSALVGLISIILAHPFAWKLFVTHTKLFAINVVLPHWNWAKLYDYDCMISNPYHVKPNITVDAEMCKYCDESMEIDRWNNVSTSNFMEMCVDTGMPLVVSDAMNGPNVKQLTMDEIGYLYQNNDMLSLTLGSCRYNNSVGLNESFYDFIGAFVDKKLPDKWFAQWENCQPKGAKVLRHYYTRPYFLPGMMQSDLSNVIITSSGKQESGWHKSLNEHQGGVFVVVISGSLAYRFKPDEECLEKFGCSEKMVNVTAGNVIFYSTEWQGSFRPNDDGITIAISTPVIWDNLN